MNLLRIFVNQNRWIKNGFARHKDGTPVEFEFPAGSNPKDPWFFSLHGAVAWYTEPGQIRQRLMDRLREAVAVHTGRNMYVAEFNNHPDTKFEDIIEVVKIASKVR